MRYGEFDGAEQIKYAMLLLTRIGVYWQILKRADEHFWKQQKKIGDPSGYSMLRSAGRTQPNRKISAVAQSTACYNRSDFWVLWTPQGRGTFVCASANREPLDGRLISQRCRLNPFQSD
jgi:hypothetical protein